ncbi:MAG: glycosyltransferase [Clostridia bacterium]|nr:glycosyltransferase [Clostridia bacterium]
MDNSKKISVIVPCYKVEKFLPICVNSIINQTYKNLEIILVDDGSPDLTGTLCDKLALTDTRIRVIHKQNGGLSSARNAGLDICTGDYISFIDSDDYIKPETFEEMLQFALNYNLDLVKCNFVRCDEKNNEDFYNDDTGEKNIYNKEEAITNFISSPYNRRKHFKVIVCDALYKKEKVISIRFPEGLLYEDGYYTPLAILNCDKLGHIDKTLYVYRVTSNSIMSSGFTERSLKSLDDWEFIYNNVKDKVPNCADLAGQRWLNKLIITYEQLLITPNIDIEDSYKKHIIHKIQINSDYFLSITTDSIVKEKVFVLNKCHKKYYKKFIKKRFIKKLKTFILSKIN